MSLPEASALAADSPEALAAVARGLIARAADPGFDAEAARPELAQLLRAGAGTGEGLPPVLAHRLSGAVAAGLGDRLAPLMPALWAEIEPVLADPADPAFRHALLILLVLRPFWGDRIAAGRIRDLHLTHFPDLSWPELALPYNAMFHPEMFGTNVAEVLEGWGTPGTPDPRLAPRHVLMLDWLAGRSLFTAPDGADLAGFLARVPWSGKDLAAARMLALRHAPAGGFAEGALPAALADLGPLMRDWSALRQTLAAAPQAGQAAVARLRSRPRQMLAAGRIVLSQRLKLPALAGRRRLRVAVCVSGQLRGYARTLPGWKAGLLAPVEAQFFVHSWFGIGNGNASPLRTVLPFAGRHFPEAYRRYAQELGYDAIQARLPALFAALAQGAQADPAQLKRLYSSENVVLEDDGGPAFAGFTGQMKMHSKIAAAQALADTAGEFDLILRIRPDLEVKQAAFDWADMHAACLARPALFAEKPFGQQYGHLFSGDQFAIARPEVMRIYAETWTRFPALAQAGLAGMPAGFEGHVSLAMTCWTAGIEMQRAPVRFGALLEAEPLSSRAILAALQADDRGEGLDRALIAAVRADLGAGA